MYKVMLADDEGIVIESLSFIIEKNFGGQCEIASAKTGRSVIELAETFRPDIAFMDIQMPGINGIEAMKEIRNRNAPPVLGDGGQQDHRSGTGADRRSLNARHGAD